MGAQGISMVYTTVEIKTEIDKSVFEINTDGYEEQTMEEFTKTMGAMGGMGFQLNQTDIPVINFD